jgi:hypothetical protein
MKGIRISNFPGLIRSGVNRFEVRADVVSGRFCRPGLYRRIQSDTCLASLPTMVVPESGFIVAEADFVTFAAFTCQKRMALSIRMFIFQRRKALIAEPSWLENRLYFANVTMPYCWNIFTAVILPYSDHDIR